MSLLLAQAANPTAKFEFKKLYAATEFDVLMKHATAGRVYYRGLSSRTWNRVGQQVVDTGLYSRPGDMYSKDMSRALAYLNGSSGHPDGKIGALMICTHLQSPSAVTDHAGHSNYEREYPYDVKSDGCRVLAVFYTKVLRMKPTIAYARAAAARITANLDQLVRDFFRVNPNPDDAQVHALAAELGMSPEELEKVIFRLFTDCNNPGDVMPAKVIASIRERAAPKDGKIQLAYLFAVPVTRAPDEALCRLLGRLQKTSHCVVHFVVSDQLKTGRSVFEVHSDNVSETTTTMISALQGYGYTVTRARTDDTVHIQKGKTMATLIFVQRA